MTGFGRSVMTTQTKKITVEIKSLNSKQFDFTLRMPSFFRDSDLKIREVAGKMLERGKVDMNIFVEHFESKDLIPDTTLTHFNLPVMKALKNKAEQVSQELDIKEPADWFQFFVRFPEAFHNDGPLPRADEAETEILMKSVDECLNNLLSYRRVEGENLYLFFNEKIQKIKKLLGEIDQFEKERITKIKEKITENLQKIQAPEYDRNRLEQEMIFYIEKLDITEEKQRLNQHLNYFLETMDNVKPGQGKKLGFISQEIGREINTLGSKSNQADMQKLVVKMKDELEQIKEQVLNVM